jgi:hypothetical protein
MISVSIETPPFVWVLLLPMARDAQAIAALGRLAALCTAVFVAPVEYIIREFVPTTDAQVSHNLYGIVLPQPFSRYGVPIDTSLDQR